MFDYNYKYFSKIFVVLFAVGVMALPLSLKAFQSSGENISHNTQTYSFDETQDTFYKVNIEDKISLKLKNASMSEALQEVAREAGLRLTYRGIFISDKKITIKDNNISIGKALSLILEDTGFDYKASRDGYLLIHKIVESNIDNITTDPILQTVSGTVTDASSGELLPGVNVVVKGTTTGTATDREGNYELEVPSLQDTLIYSFIGYERMEVPINGRNVIDIALKPISLQAQEIVVSGYQTQQKASVTGAISVVEQKVLKDKPVINPIESLQGRVAGLFVEATGDPAGDANITIRGQSTLNNNNPLYVIDGIPTDEKAFNILSSNDIESIQILKDAASASIYGSRASNGVILVTTKKGKKNNRIEVNYNSQTTISDFPSTPDMTNPRQRAEVFFWATVNDGGDPSQIPTVDFDFTQNADGTFTLNEVIIPDEIVPGVPSSNTDWVDAVSKKGIIQDHNLTVSGGSKRGNALFSLRYMTDNFLIKERKVEKISARINSSMDLDEDGRFTIGENLVITKEDDNGFDDTDVLSAALDTRQILPVRDVNGNFTGPPNGNFVDSNNPVRLVVDNRWDKEVDLNLFGNVYSNFSLTDNFSINTNFGIDWLNEKDRDIDKRFQTGFLSRETNILENTKSDDFSYTFNVTTNYVFDRDNHSATVLGGMEFVHDQFTSNTSRREDFAVEDLNFFIESAGSGAQFVDGSASEAKLLSFFTKIDYAFKDKYLTTVTIRYDGSSRFAKGNRYGTFPSFSLGWKLDQEKFFNELFPFFSEFKLRGSWGRVGNQRISNTARFGLFDVSASSQRRLIPPWARNNDFANFVTTYDIEGKDSGSLPSGFRRIQTANDELKWETSEEFNIGVDFSMKEDKIFGSIEYFDRDTEDILIQPDFIGVLGEGGDRFINGASTNVKGFEISTTYRDQIGQFNIALTGNVGYFDDEITKLPPDVVDSFPGNREKTILGESINAIFGWVADGLFQSQEEVASHAEQPGAAPGRIRFKDLNEDGVIDILDQKFLGSTTASYEYGLNIDLQYKRFDLNLFLQGVHGRDVVEDFRRTTDFASLWAGHNFSTRILDFWTPQNRDTDIPAVTLQDNNDEDRASSFFVANGRFLKVRQATLGYTLSDLPYINSLRVFASGENLLTFESNSVKGEDPEFTDDRFPIPRNITFGINVSF